MLEHAPLGLTYVIGNDADDPAYPILGISQEARSGDGDSEPAFGTAHPDTANWPSHTFIKSTPTQTDQRVLWTYRILPGPWVPFTRYDVFLGPIQGRRRAVVNTSQVPTQTATAKTTYEGENGSDKISLQIEESWSNGTGGGGNPAYPIFTDKYYDEPRGAIVRTSQIVTTEGVGSLAASGSTVVQTRFEAYSENALLFKQIIETWNITGPSIDAPRIYDEQRGAVDTTIQLVAVPSPNHGTLTSTGGVITKVSYEPFNVLQDKKTTETWAETGPALTGVMQSGNGTVGTLTKQLVPPTTAADSGFLVEQSESMEVSAVQREKTSRIADSYPQRSGHTFDEATGILFPFTIDTKVMGSDAATALTDVSPQDYARTEVKTITVPTSAINAFYRKFPASITVEFPPVLSGITTVWETAVGSGGSSETGTVSSTGNSVHLDLSIPNTNNNSATLMPEIIPAIKRTVVHDLPVDEYYFFLAHPVSPSDVVTRLTALAGAAVSAWMIFKPEPLTFVLRGQKLSLRTSAQARFSLHINDTGDISQALSHGNGSDFDFGSTVVSKELEPTIHAAITIADTSRSANVSSSAAASIGGYTSTSDSIALTGTVLASVTPSTVAATNIPTIPTSGLRYRNLESSNYKLGYVAIRAHVVDMSAFV